MNSMRLTRILDSCVKKGDFAQILSTLQLYKNEAYTERTLKRIFGSARAKLNKVKEIKPKFWDAKELYEQAKQKHLLKLSGQILNVNDNPVLSANLHFYLQMLKLAGKEHLIDKYQLVSRAHDQKDLKKLGDYMKTVGPSREKNFHYLVNIETLYGWEDETKHGEHIAEKIREWVEVQFHPKYKGSEQVFLSKFEEKVRKIIFWKDGHIDFPFSLDEFCAMPPVAGTSGSAYDPLHRGEFEITADNEKIKFQKSKFTKVMSMKSEDMKEMMLTTVSNKSNVSIKVEFIPKVRTIVSSEFSLAMQMRYLDTGLTKWMNGNPLSTLWSTPKQKMEMWQDMVGIRGVNVPIDQSSFDYHVSQEMVHIINRVIKEWIEKRVNDNADKIIIIDNIIKALLGGSVFYNIPGGKKYKFVYQNGVLSGWQWTAFYDTVVNIAEGMIAEDLMAEFELYINTLLENYQGDDQLKVVKNWVEAVAYWSAMSSLGLDINITKNFFSQKHNEYLRKWSDHEQVNGYPSRMINGMLWLYPGTNMQKSAQERCSSIVSNWLKLGQRMDIREDKLIGWIRRDCKGAKVPDETVKLILSNPRTYGGVSLIESDKVGVLDKISIEPIRYRIDAPGYHEFMLRYGENQTRELEAWALKVSKVPFDFEEDWRIEEKPKDIPFIFTKDVSVPKPLKIEGFPDQVIFGQADALMRKVFPNIENFVKNSNAPKKWVYSWVTGRAKTVTPIIKGCSDEFSSLVWNDYKNSAYRAMFVKRPQPDKWNRLNLYAEKYFSDHIRRMRQIYPVRG
jgi:hypothetical protein